MPHQHCRDLCRNGLIFPYRRARTHATPIAAPTLPQQQQQAKEQVQAKAQVQAQAPIGPEGGAPVDPMEVREPVEPTSPPPHTPPPLPRPLNRASARARARDWHPGGGRRRARPDGDARGRLLRCARHGARLHRRAPGRVLTALAANAAVSSDSEIDT